MVELPQLKNTQPVLEAVNVVGKDKKYSDFADVLGKLSETVSKESQSIEEEQSKSMYINSISNLDQLKTSAQINMLQNPDNAGTVAENMQDSIDAVKKIAYVNRGDREKLNQYAKSMQNDIDLKATEYQVRQTKLQASFTHFSNFPDQLKAYQDSLMSGSDTASSIHDGMISNLKSLVDVGAITPEQAGSSIKLMHHVSDSTANYISNFGKPDINAMQYQTMRAGLIGSDSTNNVGTPIEGSTQHLYNIAAQDKSTQGVHASIGQGNIPNIDAFTKMSDNQQQEAIQQRNGYNIAQGIINSGQPIPQIQSYYKSLQDIKEPNASQRETRNQLDMYFNELKDGNYLKVISNTPQGAAILQNAANKNSALSSLRDSEIQGINDPKIINDVNDKYNSMFLKNKNEMIDNVIAYGHAVHMPSEYVQPIPTADVNMIQNGFKLNEDPRQIFSTLSQYTKLNQVYVANALKTPDQKLIVQSLSSAGNDVSIQDKLNMIAANQSGRNYSNIVFDKNDITDSQLKTKIATSLNNQIRMLSQIYDQQTAQTLQNSMINTSLRLSKYYASQENDISMSHSSTYIDQATKLYKSAYPQMTGTNYVVNPNMLPEKLSPAQLDRLAFYATNMGYARLQKSGNPIEFAASSSRNELKMIVTSTHDIQAIDGNGNVYFSAPYNSNTMSAVNSYYNSTIKDIQKQEAFISNDDLAAQQLGVG